MQQTYGPFTRNYDSERPSTLAQRQNSMLTWEGNQILGAANISEKLTVRSPGLLAHRSRALTA